MRGASGICLVLALCLRLNAAETPIRVETRNLALTVDAAACRWSAQVKGSGMRLNDVHFLPGDDPSGWSVTSSVNNNDSNKFGSFVTVTLRGTKPGQLDFEYQVSASRNNNDILVSLGRSNSTTKAVDVVDMDYFVSDDARLGGSTDRWISLGTASRNREYYDLAEVISFITPRMYEVNHVVRDMDTEQANNTFKARQLVQHGAHIDARRLGRIGNGAVWLHTTPLLDALDEDNSEMTELLVALGANLELAAPYTPLFKAAINDRVALAKILIKGGADLQTKGRFGRCALEAAQENEKYAMVQFLTDQGATFGKSKSRRFFMHFKEAKGIVLKAVTEHNKETLEKVLRLDGIGKEEIERRDKYGQTPLLLAAECCLEEIALTLIAFKADLTAQDDEGGTALHYAASEGNQTRLVKTLLRAEADVNARNKRGETALHAVALSQVADDKKVANARLEAAKLLLKKADLKQVDAQGRTALHHAVEANNLPLVKLLAKTTPSVPDHKGQTPLLLATSLGYNEIATFLGKQK